MLSNHTEYKTSLTAIIYTFVTSLCAVVFVAACSNETTDESPFQIAGNGAAGLPVAGSSGFENPVAGGGDLSFIEAAGMPTDEGTGGTIPNETAGIAGSVPPITGGVGGIVPGTGGIEIVGTGGVEIVGTGGVEIVGTGGIVDTGGTDGTVVPTGIIPDRCNGDDSKVAMIGDSYLALSGMVTTYLRRLSGLALRRTYYISGVSFNTGIGKVPDQALTAYRAGPVQTFIMDGGGNDALLNANCTLGFANPICRSDVDEALAAQIPFLETAAENGVQEIIWFYYPHIRFSAAVMNEIDDYAIPISTANCENFTGLDCTLIDTVPAFEGHPEYIGLDGIHPSNAGAEVIANLIFEVMQENCANGLTIQ